MSTSNDPDRAGTRQLPSKEIGQAAARVMASHWLEYKRVNRVGLPRQFVEGFSETSDRELFVWVRSQANSIGCKKNWIGQAITAKIIAKYLDIDYAYAVELLNESGWVQC